MSDRGAIRVLAWALWALAIAMSIAGVVLLVLTRDVPIREVYGARGATALVAVPFATTGVLLASRRRDNPIGWLFLAAGVVAGIGVFGEQYTTYSFARHGSSLPLTDGIAWFQSWSWVPVVTLGIVYPLLLFPDGHPPSHRWRWVLWLAPVAMAGFTAGVALEPGTLQSVPIDNPLAIDQATVDRLISIGSLPFIAVPILAVVAAARRFRRSTGDEHEQVKWLLSAGALTALALVLNLILGLAEATDTPAWQAVALFTQAAIGTIPIAAAVAVLKYRLYDIEVVIRRAVAYSIVAGSLTAAYVGVIVGIGAVVGRFAGSNVVLPIVATAVAAAAALPVWHRARSLANRLVYGKRTGRYEALAALAGTQSLEEFPGAVARVATESTAARRSVVWLSTELELEVAAIWPNDGPRPAAVPVEEGAVPELPDGEHMYSLIHQGDLLGALTVATPPGEPLPADDNRLLSDLASQAATALRGMLEAIPLPEGIVTFLMTDVEGSTRLWQETPEGMAAAVHDHDLLVRRAVQASGGILMKWRGEGDSTFSVFPHAEHALVAAAALQRAVGEHAWQTPRPMRVRAAVHTGQAELRGRDYFGQAVNRCARVRGVAEGGQTLISAATRELVRDRIPEDLDVHDLGERELKDLGPERVYELRPASVPGRPDR